MPQSSLLKDGDVVAPTPHRVAERMTAGQAPGRLPDAGTRRQNGPCCDGRHLPSLFCSVSGACFLVCGWMRGVIQAAHMETGGG